MHIRLEASVDGSAIRAVHEAAFATSTEAEIVDALRKKSKALISLVAEVDGKIIGHILFSPLSLADQPDTWLLGLGPMGVAPAHQRQGVGSALVRGGLELCRHQGYAAVVVLGHPEYYPRFGFVPASRYGLSCEYDVPDDVWMAIELQQGSLAHVSGTVIYDEVFGRS